jgi:carboxyl-terminal processing protease
VTQDGATEIPYVVLINGGSASTSEILAGAIQDNGGGTLVGTRTVGKGIIQKLEQFTDGDGARITIAQYFTPKGNPVHGVGITPDYIVEIEPEAESDAQLERAIHILLDAGAPFAAKAQPPAPQGPVRAAARAAV